MKSYSDSNNVIVHTILKNMKKKKLKAPINCLEIVELNTLKRHIFRICCYVEKFITSFISTLVAK